MNYRMTYRARVLWLPALAALTLSSALLALLQFTGLAPRFYWLSDRMSMDPYFTVYVPWLIVLPVVGAVAAYWSRRVGGTVLHRLIAALAPAAAVLGSFLLIWPVGMIVDRQVPRQTQLYALLVMTASWVLAPSIPLLIGAAFFLRGKSVADPRASA